MDHREIMNKVDHLLDEARTQAYNDLAKGK